MNKALLSCTLWSLACLLFVGCSTGANRLGHAMASHDCNVFTVDAEPGLSVQQVRRAILLSLDEREWTIDGERDNTIVAELNRLQERHILGRVSITYTKDRVTVTDLSFDQNGKPFVPVRWICYLQHSLIKYLSQQLTPG